MVALNILVFAAGAAVVALTLRSVVRTTIVPRALQAYLTRAVFIGMRRVFRLRAGMRHSYEMRDRIMAFYAPVSLLALLLVWLALFLTGYAGMFWALGNYPVRRALTLSGSSLLTLGFAATRDLPSTILAFTEAAIGLIVLALLITYLPSLYNAFQRRERGVSKLEVRAGRPPWGVRLIEAACTTGHLETLHELWKEWEEWFVDVDESHTSFPSLAFFRSPHADESWVTAAGAVLDGAALYVSVVDGPRIPEPEFMLRSGSLCLRHVADFFQIPFDPDMRPEEISVSREEFDAAYDRLGAAGVPTKPDRERCWRDFAGWRASYDSVLIRLAQLTMAPVAPWSSDRMPEGVYVPPLFPRRTRGSS